MKNADPMCFQRFTAVFRGLTSTNPLRDFPECSDHRRPATRLGALSVAPRSYYAPGRSHIPVTGLHKLNAITCQQRFHPELSRFRSLTRELSISRLSMFCGSLHIQSLSDEPRLHLDGD